MRPGGLLVLVALLSAACGSSTSPGYVSTADLKRHPEAGLVYPNSYNVASVITEELDAPFLEESPTPAFEQTDFSTADRVDRVVAWYEDRLSSRGWADATDQGNGNRRWERGAHEDFDLNCSYVESNGDRRCLAVYTLRAPRFPAPMAAAPPFGSDPVAVGVVRERRVGLAATEFRVQYLSGPPIPAEGTAAAAAARAQWPKGWCCASPVMLDDSSLPADPSGARSAYHAALLQVAEYDRPDVQGDAFGSIERDEIRNLEDAGFVLANVGSMLLAGSQANAYVFERGLREAVVFSIAYGSPSIAGQGVRYRVATVQIVYDVAPASCDLSRSECFDTLAGTAGVSWIHA